MSNSESPTRVSTGPVVAPHDFGRLVDAPTNQRLRVVAVGPEHQSALTQEGLGLGSEVSVERRLALGGPMVVRLGRTRLALARSVAAAILVTRVDEPS